MGACEYCKKDNPDLLRSDCPFCGFPTLGSDEDKYKFLYMKSIPCQADMVNAESGLKKAKWAMFAAAVIAFLDASVNIGRLDVPEIILFFVTTVALGVIFLALGIFFRKHSLILSIAGLVLSIIFINSILGVMVILLLAYGVWCATTYNKAKLRLDTIKRKMLDYNKK